MLSIVLAIFLAQVTGDGPPVKDTLRNVPDESGRQTVAPNPTQGRTERPCDAQPVTEPQAKAWASISSVDACFLGLPWGCVALGIVSSGLLWFELRSQRRG